MTDNRPLNFRLEGGGAISAALASPQRTSQEPGGLRPGEGGGDNQLFLLEEYHEPSLHTTLPNLQQCHTGREHPQT